MSPFLLMLPRVSDPHRYAVGIYCGSIKFVQYFDVMDEDRTSLAFVREYAHAFKKVLTQMVHHYETGRT
jgi:hypothetical protein